jgi:cation transport ATPase
MQTVPPTSEATSATVQQMGVYVKMVTGDQLAIGRESAGQLGLDAGGMGRCAGMVI